MRHIRNIKIEDLLERDVIHMEDVYKRQALPFAAYKVYT